MERILVVLRGVSGSGKTFTAERLGGTKCSSDEFFIDEQTGEYNWNQGGLKKAHVWNQERCRIAMERGDEKVVVDNCNLARQDAAPYVEMALQHGYQVEIIDCGDGNEGLSAQLFAQRNVHQVPVAAIEEQMRRYERYSVNDVIVWARDHKEEDSKEVIQWRARYRDKLMSTSRASPTTTTTAASFTPTTTKLRIEVCKNDGQANPCKPLVIGSGDSLAAIMEQACKKLRVGYNAKKCTLYTVKGASIEQLAFHEGERVVVAHDGKPFVEIQVKKSAAEKREAKLRDASSVASLSSSNHHNSILAQVSKLSSGASLIVDGLYIGSGRDGRDPDVISQMDTIVNVAKEWPPLDSSSSLFPSHCAYVHLGILDEPYQYLDSFLPMAFAAIAAGSRVLVHCIRGASRSAAVVCCYLVARKGYSARDAIALVCEKRPQVCMNPFFVAQIEQLAKNVSGGGGGGGDIASSSIPELLLSNRLNVSDILKGFAQRLEGPSGTASHLLKSRDGIHKDEYYAVPSAIRNALFQLDASAGGSQLVELPCGRFRLHFDLPSANLVAGARKAVASRTPQGVDDFSVVPMSGGGAVRLVFPHIIVDEAEQKAAAHEFVSGLPASSSVPSFGSSSLENCSIFPPPRSSSLLLLSSTKSMTELLVISFLNRSGKDAAQTLCKQYGIKLSRHGKFRQLHQFTYSSRNSMLGDALVGECRGIVVERVCDGNWRVVALPFLKFFNLGDDRAKQFDWTDFNTFEKLDGMMVMLYAYQGEWNVATQSVPDGSNMVGEAGVALSVHDLFFEICAARGYIVPKMETSSKLVYVFELLSRKCQVVVGHSARDDLVLIGVRDMDTLQEMDCSQVASDHGWPCAPRFHFVSQEEVVERARRLTGTVCEGFVVCDRNWNRLKVKAPSYVAIFHLKGCSLDGPLEPKHLVPIVLNGEEDEVAIYFPHLREQLSLYRLALTQVEDALAAGTFLCPLPVGQAAPDFVRLQPVDVVADWLQRMLPTPTKEQDSASSSSTPTPGSPTRMSKAEKQAQKAKRKAERKASKK